MEKAAAYIRVSTDDQTEFSPDAQLRAIRKYCEDKNIALFDRFIYRDEGISGRRAEARPGFMRMISDAKRTPKSFDTILVHKFDRFARNREDSVIFKSMLRKQCGVRVVSITERIEDDKFSIILESMLEAMAEYYECVKHWLTNYLFLATSTLDKSLIPNNLNILLAMNQNPINQNIHNFTG